MIGYKERHRLNEVEGLITQAEGEHLAELAARVPEWSTIVEIGSHTGRSTCYLAAGARVSGAHVVAVDPFADPRPPGVGYDDDPFDLGTGDAVLRRFCDNLTAEGAWDRVTVLRAPSVDVASVWVNPVGLLFLDAMHRYEDVLADCRAWLPLVFSGQRAAFHDWESTDESEVQMAVLEALDESWHLDGRVDNLQTAVKA